MSFIAIEKMIEVMLPGARPDFIIIGLCIIALLYSVASGLYAVVITDFFQFIFAAIGTITLVVIVYIHVGPPAVLIQKVTALTGDPTFTNIVPTVPVAGAAIADVMKFVNFILFVLVLWMFHGSLVSGGGDPQRKYR
jgi:Na+/proline symporter